MRRRSRVELFGHWRAPRRWTAILAGDHPCALSSSWTVTSFTTSNRRLPFGVVTFTSSPSSLFTSAPDR